LKKFIIELVRNKFFLTIQDRKVDITDFFENSKGHIRAFNRKKKEQLHLTTITPQDEKRVYKPMQYLGFEFDGQNIRIRNSSLSRYFKKLRARLDKTVCMAYSPNTKGARIFERQIFERYTHL
jgi:RNA-directed DNA polymerase